MYYTYYFYLLCIYLSFVVRLGLAVELGNGPIWRIFYSYADFFIFQLPYSGPFNTEKF
jgi:hypothetical protein